MTDEELTELNYQLSTCIVALGSPLDGDGSRPYLELSKTRPILTKFIAQIRLQALREAVDADCNHCKNGHIPIRGIDLLYRHHLDSSKPKSFEWCHATRIQLLITELEGETK